MSRRLRVFLCLMITTNVVFIGNAQLSLFFDECDRLIQEVVVDGLVDYSKALKLQEEFSNTLELAADFDLGTMKDQEIISAYINVYNLHVISLVLDRYPLASVKEVSGFFDRQKITVAGSVLSLNEIEKDILLKRYNDPRFHFALVCGAVDCPKLRNEAYRPDRLSEQLLEQTALAVNDINFIKGGKMSFEISEIFQWYESDFGSGKSGSVQFINKYRNTPIPTAAHVRYYKYDWGLNDIGRLKTSGDNSNNALRYVTSAAVPKGGTELKIFNNLYTQSSDSRSTYHTTILSYLYGVSSRFNIGLTSRYRRVLNASSNSSRFDIYGPLDGLDARARLSAVGPQIRWDPAGSAEGFSIQSSLTFQLGSELSGSADAPFLDWAGPVFWTQFFYDRSIGDKFSLFSEIDLLIEEIGESTKSNRVSTPITSILSYFPHQKVTIYGLVGYSPFIVKPYDYFYQYGLGFKYQLTRQFEVELLATDFSNKFLNEVDGQASTFNIGFRYSR